jgi:hypothetical protein
MQVKFQKSRFNLLIPSILDFIQKSEDGEYTLKIEKVKRKRSIDANNYSWMLTDKLSEKLLDESIGENSKVECDYTDGEFKFISKTE